MAEFTQEVAEELDRLAGESGELDHRDVVKAARRKDSPLHPFFTWDDREAAEEHRADQARILIRRYTVEYRIGPLLKVRPKYVRDPWKPPTEPGYTVASRGRADKEWAADLLSAEFSRVVSALNRAESLAEYFEMEESVRDVKGRVEGLAQRLLQMAP